MTTGRGSRKAMKKILVQRRHEKQDKTQGGGDRIDEEDMAHLVEIRKVIAEASRRKKNKVPQRIIVYSVLLLLMGWGGNCLLNLYKSYDSVHVITSNEMTAQVNVQEEQARANLQAAGVNPDNVNGPRLNDDTPKLDEVSQNFYVENGFYNVEGEVKNISPDRLANVEAVVTFYDRGHNVIKTADALIEYNPVLPGQRSPFHVVATGNPAIKTETLTFAFLNGAEIPASFR